ncbi:MAG: VacJ family lipoprotein [Syntrophales bacterium]|nr:VacJ family lipoprotein [Syntrophales bacterium]
MKQLDFLKLLTGAAILVLFASIFPQYAQSSPPQEDVLVEATEGGREDVQRTEAVADPPQTEAQQDVESVETPDKNTAPEVKTSDTAKAETPSAVKSGETADEGAEEVGEEEEIEREIEIIPDPLKSFNHLMFRFNDKLYFYFLKPIARGYKAVLPEKVRLSVRNALSNIATPVRFINCTLQGKLKSAGTELARFLVNTTWGVLGLFDPAKNYFHLEKAQEDFGQTLGKYGIKEGFYIIWPFFGPSNVRDTIGMAGDFFADPLFYINPRTDLGFVEVNTTYPTIGTATDKLNETSLTLGTYEEFKESAIDPYVSTRNAYFEYRRNQIKK